MLTSKGYTVLAAQKPSDVESICKEHSGSIHLLLTDMMLPGASGRENCQASRWDAPRHQGSLCVGLHR